MKAVLEPIEVQLGGHGAPVRFAWKGRRYAVTDVLDAWRYGGRWWRQEPPRDCYLVASSALTAELHREDRPGGVWWLARVQD